MSGGSKAVCLVGFDITGSVKWRMMNQTKNSSVEIGNTRSDRRPSQGGLLALSAKAIDERY